MELNISDIPPTICLNMIVKNESHIIKNTLEKLCNKINFSYWVICDTGSTDNTREIITEFFNNKDIPGELHNHQWKNFSHNRSIALDEAFNKTDLLFIFDADDEIQGNINMPQTVDNDGYFLNFGTCNGISYQRILLVNNRIKWCFKSVIHEYIECSKPNPRIISLNGDYYVVSGRSGSRNSDPEKYLKDAKVLEEAYYEAKEIDDELYLRYGFYCANSYKDAGKKEQAIKWYKITLNNNNWYQEKYMCCLNLYNLYNSIEEKEKALYYLVESFHYDTERLECVSILVKEYCLKGFHKLAYSYYLMVKDFYENSYLNSNTNGKLFIDSEKANFFLPYYMILVADKVKSQNGEESNKTIIKMYEIIFTKKYHIRDDFFIGNLLYNLQFFIELCIKNNNFVNLFQSYIDFLEKNMEINLFKHTFLKEFEKYGVHFQSFGKPKYLFTDEECKKSKKILIYTGFSNLNWNYTYSLNNPLGGSETAVTNLIKSLPNDFEIFVCGQVSEEKICNIQFVSLDNIRGLIEKTPFHTFIISRYIAFYEIFSEASFYQSFIWGHDIILFNYGCDLDVHSILNKWNNKINGCICQTEWHKNIFLNHYSQLKNKLFTINNGIPIDKFVHKPNKVRNKFIYTSCSERGLDRLLELWPSILESLPDATLSICSYNKFPQNDFENGLKKIIDANISITHLGSLNRDNLYELMASSEYWLYTTNFNETSCITAMEMLMSNVICIYYPLAGLVNTLGNYGIPIERGQEISTILNLSDNQKSEIIQRGKEYALSCSWDNRADEWVKIMNLNGCHNSNIKIINLKNREDRRLHIQSQFEQNNIFNYQFVEAVNGKTLKETNELALLFERNDFNNRKGEIGCALSHILLWNALTNDAQNNYYVILEDDIHICNNFEYHLNKVCKMFVEQNLDHLALGEYHSNRPFPDNSSNIEIYTKDLYNGWNTFFAYIISKSAAVNILKYINKCSIKCAIDNPQAYGHIITYSGINYNLVDCQIVNEFGTNIQTSVSDNYFNFNVNVNVNSNANINDLEPKTLRVSFCDWWQSEYCGGSFDKHDNFFVNILKNYGNNYNIIIVEPENNPDILFYSIFGSSHNQYNAKRKIFFSGEPYGADISAHYNLTFDENSLNNVRLPLWVCYFDNSLLDECNKRKNKTNVVLKRHNFCSFIATGPGLTNNRKDFIEKLSEYKMVDCGGAYLNNIGYNVPLGINCSGKIAHNNNYKFAIAFESKSYPGYVTEKICDIFKSNCLPIYWGHPDVIKDFNPKTFINANDFSNFNELVDYIIRVDNNDTLYESFFKEPMLQNKWIDILTDPNKCFFKNIADNIIGENDKLFENYLKISNHTNKKKVNIFNIWHNKLFDECYENLDTYSLNKIIMYDVNPVYEKIYNTNKNYKIVKEYELEKYDNLFQATNYCQASCLYHIFLNNQTNKYSNFYSDNNYIGFIQYDMVLDKEFIYEIEDKINDNENNIIFYSLVAKDKLERHLICEPYCGSILEQYNNYFNTTYRLEYLRIHEKSKYFICLHTFVIPSQMFTKMMQWYLHISDWLHNNLVSNLYKESMSEVTEEIFGLFLLLEMIENDKIELCELKLIHNWPNLHNETSFNNYKESDNYFPLSSIINNKLTDKNSCHSFIEPYENLFKGRQLTTKNVLEIGIENGGSLKLWNDYFVNAEIYGLDFINPPVFLSRYKRIKTKKCDVYNDEVVRFFLDKSIKFDIIIDNGLHTLESMFFVLEKYTELLNENGLLILEDVQAIEWCDTLYEKVPDKFKKTAHYIDRRSVKGRHDDILFIVESYKQNVLNSPIKTIKHIDSVEPVKLTKDLWILYAYPGHNFKVIEDYILSLQQSLKQFDIVYTKDLDYILSSNAKRISYIMYILDNKIIDKFKNTNVEISFLNTEPLSISKNLDLLKNIVYKYPHIKIYDYSFSNLQIILHHNMYGELLDYIPYYNEKHILEELNSSQEKIYDFGIITYGNTETNTIDSLFYRKKEIATILIEKGFNIHIISGWGIDRDRELSKCKVILNVHSVLIDNDITYCSKTFENIRCNRLLDAGFKILSEDSLHSIELTNKYSNLKFINYNDFKNINYSDDFWEKINRNKIKKYCFIHSCNLENAGTYRLNYLVTKIKDSNCLEIFDKIYINNIGIPIKNIYGDKFEIINYSDNPLLFENPTINMIKMFSQENPDAYILYIHTKGVRYSVDDHKENDWIDLMLYFLVEQHKLCISVLDDYYDVVGCNYSRDIDKTVDGWKNHDHFQLPSHYSGNFWWANSNYLRNLPLLCIEKPDRMAPEFWLTTNNPVVYNFHSSQILHFIYNYPRHKYALK